MAITQATLAAEVIANFPANFDYSLATQANRRFLDELCTGFVNMWTAGILTPGIGPPPPGSFPHVHTITTLASPTMVAGIAALGLGPLVLPWATVIATETALHLIANATMDSQQGELSHAHAFLAFPAGSDTTLKTTILNQLPALGFEITNPQSAQDPWMAGWSKGVLDEVVNNGSMTLAIGAAHIHLLL